ncbi:2,3-bisphosphoglycerate-independent phosphoglycerate mutase [Fonticula alba]|uniref:phosphoglycerate mutase (2,3-diphosphoglycerate-independent) n=1 Tax=Fonticula alba TaxID=691883 RepID=A0A058ZEH1_FONAL|nr:2,3-bisphosphoglycerate-independent phosphoglycerate mutase [Fonticula alba]KCV72346.1 2,3-bisphosphoglycerate-independent phosphoglycerate mutase [Fonticula alba]|eukprot:XP_009493924.1 2,3-bisphosphoglycerate-independent phosphoglycerate mutase [Fonticula alba]
MSGATVPGQRVCLIVIDGWGITPETKGNAVYHGCTEVMDRLAADGQHVSLAAHGRAVGLPAGLMGNSEVGHLNIGAGRVVEQDIVRIDAALLEGESGPVEDIPIVRDLFNKAAAGGRLHFLGLVSDGGVHSHMAHLKSLMLAAQRTGIPESFVHFFADGRDTAPTSTLGYTEQMLQFLAENKYGSIATMTGRYYAMDRDTRWERTKIAYDMLVGGIGEASTDLLATIKARYDAGETDEFLKPIIHNTEGLIRDGDTILMFNYRSDRMRQLAQVFNPDNPTLPFESDFPRPKDLHIKTMTRYHALLDYDVLFPPKSMDNVLAQWLSKKGLSQYHVAETEKYAHVTFFFNGGLEKAYAGEERMMVPSPKVATYDLLPEMNAQGVAEEVAAGVRSGKHAFVMCNFAPPDMVGHTGNFDAAVKAISATDAAIGLISQACLEAGYVLMITADHGNAEQMIDSETGQPHTAHTCNRVPFIIHPKVADFLPEDEGMRLCDVAPTILRVMGLDQPSEMTGRSLLA